MATITRNEANTVLNRLREVITWEFGDKFDIEIGNGSFTPNTGRVAVKVILRHSNSSTALPQSSEIDLSGLPNPHPATAPSSANVNRFKFIARQFGMSPDAINTVIRVGRTDYQIVGAILTNNPNAVNIIQLRHMGNGRIYRGRALEVAGALMSSHPHLDRKSVV